MSPRWRQRSRTSAPESRNARLPDPRRGPAPPTSPAPTAARVAAFAAWRSGRARVLVASVQALLQHTIDPGDLPEEAWRITPGSRVGPEQLIGRLYAMGYQPVLEVAGRGEFARRGG